MPCLGGGGGLGGGLGGGGGEGGGLHVQAGCAESSESALGLEESRVGPGCSQDNLSNKPGRRRRARRRRRRRGRARRARRRVWRGRARRRAACKRDKREARSRISMFRQAGRQAGRGAGMMLPIRRRSGFHRKARCALCTLRICCCTAARLGCGGAGGGGMGPVEKAEAGTTCAELPPGGCQLSTTPAGPGASTRPGIQCARRRAVQSRRRQQAAANMRRSPVDTRRDPCCRCGRQEGAGGGCCGGQRNRAQPTSLSASIKELHTQRVPARGQPRLAALVPPAVLACGRQQAAAALLAQAQREAGRRWAKAPGAGACATQLVA